MKRLLLVLLLLFLSFSAFASYTLEELSLILTENNGTLRQADEKVKAASLELKDAKSNFSPNISFTGTATYMVNPPIGQITLSSDEVLSQMGLGGVGGNGYVTLYDGMENTMLMGSLSLTQPLFTWGKLTDAVSLYDSALSAALSQRSDTKAQLLSELKVRVWALKYMEELSSLLDQAEAYAAELVSMAEAAYKSGMSLRTDYLSAKVSASETTLRVLDLEKERNEMLSALRLLLGKGDLEAGDIAFPEGEDEIFSRYDGKEAEAIVEEALAASGSLNAARSLLDVYSLQEKIARKSLYGIPDFALQASLTYGGSRVPFVDLGWRQKDDYSLTLTLAFTTTLWDGGKLMNSVEKAESSIRSTEALLDDASIQIKNAVLSNMESVRHLKAGMEYNQARLEVVEEQLEAMEVEVRYGQKGRREVVEKNLEKISIEAELIAQKISLVQNVFTPDYLRGIV